jgi:hypothetical protein
MIGSNRIAFDPAMPWPVLIGLAVFAALLWGLYFWRGGGSPILRGIGLVFILLGLTQPQWVRETREASQDIALVLIDQSESMRIAGRAEAARAAGERLTQALIQQSLEVRVREARGGPDGTMIAPVIEDALGDIAPERIAGTIILTEGQASDSAPPPERLRETGPAHVLIVGDPHRGDRRLELISAPTFAIVGEPMRVRARVIDPDNRAFVRVRATIDGANPLETRVRANQPFDLTLSSLHRGQNMVILEAETGPQEISPTNNRAAFAVSGVRERLRVLLITGEPHPGARVWRNLLKSDPAVDLVHFTILRPPEKQDMTPLPELALIPFPTDELFEQRLGEFDLIIFDRYRRRGILAPYYYANIARRVEQGGALLIAAGPAEATRQGATDTALAGILPSQPTGRMITQAYRPTPTTVGQRHPILRGLPDPSLWGEWTREVDARAAGGTTILSGAGNAPLLVVDRVGQGRVAQLWSDQAWLWARGHDGGGPHGELFRRLAHWLMQEPDLEDERLTLEPAATGLSVTRASLADAPGAVEVTGPSGQRFTPSLTGAGAGLWRGGVETSEQGLYEARAQSSDGGELRAFAALGPLNPREAAALVADPEILRPLARATDGGVLLTGERAQDLPEVRRVERGARAFGSDWIGLRRNNASVVRAATASPLAPGWAWAALGVVLLMLAWRREAR